MQRRAPGVTLIECLVALALTALCLALAMPSWQAALRAQRVRAAAASLHDALRSARLHALQHGCGVRLCPSADGQHCQHAARWEQGWVARGDAACLASAPALAQAALAGVRIDASGALARGAGFDAAGWPRQPTGAWLMGRWRVCPWPPTADARSGRELVLAAGGRLREHECDCGAAPARPGLPRRTLAASVLSAGSACCRPAWR